jgi:hypothetical protein
MIYKALASAIMGAVLSSTKKEVINVAQRRIAQSQMEGVRKAMLSHVAEKYTEEVEYNFSQYIRALGEATVDIEYKGRPGEALIMRAESAVKELEGYIEAQNPNGAVIQFLQRRYKEEGVRIISGRLYAGHYVNRKSQGIYEVLNRMGYASEVDRRKPWLTGQKTTEGLENMLADAAVEIFNVMFDDVDLSSDMANLNFSGVGDQVSEKQEKSAGTGFATSAPARPKGKRKRKR